VADVEVALTRVGDWRRRNVLENKQKKFFRFLIIVFFFSLRAKAFNPAINFGMPGGKK